MRRCFWGFWMAVCVAWGQGSDPGRQCEKAEFRTMDFLLGDWEVRDGQGRLMGHSRFETRAHGCALVEHWRGVRGGQGTGLMFYDAAAADWVRVYVGPGFIENGFRGKRSGADVEFSGAVAEQGKTLQMRVRYVAGAEGPKIVDQESGDGGKSWSEAATKTMTRARQTVDFAMAGQPAGVCQQPEYRQFDFWLGQWKVTMGGKAAGANRIEAASRGCVLIENWTGADGVEGISFNYYDPGTGRWHQRWAAPGGVLALEGGLEGGAMRMRQQTGARAEEIRWSIEGANVRQRWQTSKDGGKTWGVTFEGVYSRE